MFLGSRHAAAAGLYADAFAVDAGTGDNVKSPHRYNAACSAALAGTGRAKDSDKLDDKERARLRKQALDWLRADLKQWRKRGTTGTPDERKLARAMLQHWKDDPDFAGVRGAVALNRLSAEEKAAWQNLWDEVTELLTGSAGKP